MIASESARLRFTVVIAAIGAAMAQVDRANAQGQNEAASRALFIEGRQLMKAQRFEEACGKFEAARALYASAGLLLNLADCHQRINRTASAWTEFGDAADAAARAGRPGDEAEARRRQAEVQGKLSLLSVTVEGATADEVVKRDASPLERSAWGVGIPVDPGAHTIAAGALGRKAWSVSVNVKEAGTTVTVRVPPLEAIGPVAESRSTPAPASSAQNLRPTWPEPSSGSRTVVGNGQRAAGWVVGGAGVIALASSGVLAILAKSQFDSAENDTTSNRHAESVQAGQLADVATGVLIAGGVLTAAGIVVWLTAPTARVAVGANGSQVIVAGVFP